MSADVERLEEVCERLGHAAEGVSRDPGEILLIAITKGVEAARIEAVVAAGVTDIGESRVQEAEAKKAEMAVPVRWHMVGHLQSNKAARAARLFAAVHSLDSPAIATDLARHTPIEADPIAALLEVDFTGIAQRDGLAEAEVVETARALCGLPGIHLMGLMTIAPPSAEAEGARPYFTRLRELRDGVEQQIQWPLPELSMGMSSDFEVAVEEGATMVRIGQGIFGARESIGKT